MEIQQRSMGIILKLETHGDSRITQTVHIQELILRAIIITVIIRQDLTIIQVLGKVATVKEVLESVTDMTKIIKVESCMECPHMILGSTTEGINSCRLFISLSVEDEYDSSDIDGLSLFLDKCPLEDYIPPLNVDTNNLTNSPQVIGDETLLKSPKILGEINEKEKEENS